MWSYIKVGNERVFHFGVLKGPNAFELNVHHTIDFRKSSEGELIEVIVNYIDSEGDHESSISFRKTDRPVGASVISVSSEEIGGWGFCLDYDVSFDTAVSEMREHFEYLE